MIYDKEIEQLEKKIKDGPALGDGVIERAIKIYLLREKGYSTAQIGEALGISYAVVVNSKTIITRAKKVKELLEQTGKSLDDI